MVTVKKELLDNIICLLVIVVSDSTLLVERVTNFYCIVLFTDINICI